MIYDEWRLTVRLRLLKRVSRVCVHRTIFKTTGCCFESQMVNLNACRLIWCFGAAREMFWWENTNNQNHSTSKQTEIYVIYKLFANKFEIIRIKLDFAAVCPFVFRHYFFWVISWVSKIEQNMSLLWINIICNLKEVSNLLFRSAISKSQKLLQIDIDVMTLLFCNSE